MDYERSDDNDSKLDYVVNVDSDSDSAASNDNLEADDVSNAPMMHGQKMQQKSEHFHIV